MDTKREQLMLDEKKPYRKRKHFARLRHHQKTFQNDDVVEVHTDEKNK